MNSILREKRQIFSDLCIPWDDKIQREFDLEMSKRNNADPQVVADIICHDYIEYAMNHHTEAMHEFLKSKCKRGEHFLYARDITREIGKDGLQDLINADLVSPIMVGSRKAYIL